MEACCLYIFNTHTVVYKTSAGKHGEYGTTEKQLLYCLASTTALKPSEATVLGDKIQNKKDKIENKKKLCHLHI